MLKFELNWRFKMKKIKYLLVSIVLLGVMAEVSSAALSTVFQETRVVSRRFVRPLSRTLSTVAAERELASIGKSRNPTGEMNIPKKSAVYVDWEEQVATGPRFGERKGSRVVSVERIPGVGVHGILEPEEKK